MNREISKEQLLAKLKKAHHDAGLPPATVNIIYQDISGIPENEEAGVFEKIFNFISNQVNNPLENNDLRLFEIKSKLLRELSKYIAGIEVLPPKEDRKDIQYRSLTSGRGNVINHP